MRKHWWLSPAPPLSFSNRLFPIAVLLACLVYIALAGNMPLTILMWQDYDDALFIRLASKLVSGSWLGDYNQLTLVKPPGYPLFLAAASLTGLPLNLVEAITHLLASLAAAYVLSRFFERRREAFLIILIAVLVSPAIYLTKARVVREFFYASLTLAVLAAWIHVFINAHDRRSPFIAAAGGFLLGLLWYTREEGVWILPSLLILVSYPFLRRVEEGAVVWKAKAALTNLAIALGCAAAFSFALQLINLNTYGTRSVVEMKDISFQRAMIALQRVGAVYERPYVPVPKEARAQIYTISPSFATLRPELEKPPHPVNCEILPSTCGDIAGGWFMWVFRDAAAKLGHHRSAKHARRFYRHVAFEVEAACADGRLQCKSWLPPLIPHITADQWTELPEKLLRSIQVVLYQTGFAKSFEPSALEYDDAGSLELLNYPVIVNEDGTIDLSPVRRKMLDAWRAVIVFAKTVMPYLIVLAFVVTLPWAAYTAKQPYANPVIIIFMALLAGIAARVAILVLIDISSFPTLYYQRFGVIGVLTSLCVALGLISGLQNLRRLRAS